MEYDCDQGETGTQDNLNSKHQQLNQLQNICLAKYLGVEAYCRENIKKYRWVSERIDQKKDKIRIVTTEQKIQRSKNTDWQQAYSILESKQLHHIKPWTVGITLSTGLRF